MVFMPYSDHVGAVGLAERFRAAIAEQPLVLEDRDLEITASFGVACLSNTDESPLDLLNRADEVLYDAKGEGGNTVKTRI